MKRHAPDPQQPACSLGFLRLTARVARSKSREDLIGLHDMAKDVDWITVDRRIDLQLDFTATMRKALARAKVVDTVDEPITKIDSDGWQALLQGDTAAQRARSVLSRKGNPGRSRAG
jgi:hypothetical protein